MQVCGAKPVAAPLAALHLHIARTGIYDQRRASSLKPRLVTSTIESRVVNRKVQHRMGVRFAT
jgi:hypothetical protein